MPEQQNKKTAEESQSDSALSADKETLHTPDPEKKMEGPVSSSVKKVGGAFDTDESKEEATRERDEKM